MNIGYDGETLIQTADGLKKAKDIRLTDKIVTKNAIADIHNIDVRNERDYSIKITYDGNEVYLAQYHSIYTKNYGLLQVADIDKNRDVLLWCNNGVFEEVKEYDIKPMPPERRTFITMTVDKVHYVLTDGGLILHN